jgi:hypothetical protein
MYAHEILLSIHLAKIICMMYYPFTSTGGSMKTDPTRAYLKRKIDALGGVLEASREYGIPYSTLASILGGFRPMGELTISRIKEADPSINVDRLRAMKSYQRAKS